MQWLGFEATHYATMNSAAFCYAVVEYMLTHYPDRFVVYEHAKVGDISSVDTEFVVMVGGYRVKATDVVLATNAFSDHTIDGKKDDQHVKQLR